MLKTSKYVFLFQRDGKNFIYNSRTNSFYELPDEAFDLISRVKIGECSDIIPGEFAEDLRKVKILTTEEEEKRYLDFLRLAYLRSAFGSEAVNMTILPTVSCNLLGESSYNLCTLYNEKEGEGLASALYEYYLSSQRQTDTR